MATIAMIELTRMGTPPVSTIWRLSLSLSEQPEAQARFERYRRDRDRYLAMITYGPRW